MRTRRGGAFSRRALTRQVSGEAHLALTLSRDAQAMGVVRRLRIPIYDLGCGGASAATIERELAGSRGVLRAYVNPATETAHISYDPSEIDPWELARIVEHAGYRPGRPLEA